MTDPIPDDLSEIVDACNDADTDDLVQPSLEAENAYSGPDVELDEEQEDAIDRLTNEE